MLILRVNIDSRRVTCFYFIFVIENHTYTKLETGTLIVDHPIITNILLFFQMMPVLKHFH